MSQSDKQDLLRRIALSLPLAPTEQALALEGARKLDPGQTELVIDSFQRAQNALQRLADRGVIAGETAAPTPAQPAAAKDRVAARNLEKMRSGKTGVRRLTVTGKAVRRDVFYSLDEAVKLVKLNAKAKFDETVEIAMNLGIDPRSAEQMVRGMVNLPNGTGKTVRVAVFAKAGKADEALAAGADIVGADDLAEKILAGQIDFDRCIATPDMMGVVGKLGKVLGPRGLMPNPKLGTVTPNVADAVRAAKAGAVEFRAEKAGIIQAGVGKVSFSEEALVQNIRAFVDAISRAKPSGAKATYIEKVSLSSSGGRKVYIFDKDEGPETMQAFMSGILK